MLSKKISNRTIEYKHQLKNWLVDTNLLPNQQNYQKFVIVCGIRTGSTMLCSLLSKHSQTLMFFELFHHHLESIPFHAPGYRAKSQDKRIVDLRNSDPVEFLKTEIYKPHPQKIQAVGFKLIYTQGRTDNPWWNSSDFDRWWKDVGRPPSWSSTKSDLWSYLKENTDIAIIHMRRKNLLQRIVSTFTAQATGNWGVGATGGLGDNKKEVKFDLNFDECRQDFEAIRKMEDEADEFFANHKKLVIAYEDLIENMTNTTNNIEEFLGLEIKKLNTETKKQATKLPSEMITNYQQLKEQFSGTP
ncbi:Stf0 family sulfotransferase [Coleofasciculus sp.]|uniref:Stf0 family sulfotransferase n=1 Tax=Coleofasciculus sp. TaxID=3100458 RepID=UPI003A2EC754